MKVTVEGKIFDLLDEEQLLNTEVMAIEKASGQVISTWGQGTMSMSVITGLVWATMKREQPQLRFQDVSFTMSDLDASDDEDEGEDEGKGSEPDAS